MFNYWLFYTVWFEISYRGPARHFAENYLFLAISKRDKKLTCRRETARRFLSLNILLSPSRSLKINQNDTVELGVCKSLLVFH